VVTIAPLDSFVRNVGGEHVSVMCLCTTRGPHHFEYDIQDSTRLRKADLFLAIGLELDEAFADKLQQHSQNTQLRYVKLGEELPPKLLHKGEHEHGHGHHDEDEGEGHEGHHHHGVFDPHVWLGIEQACALVNLVRDELKKVDADEGHHADYDRNAEAYIGRLKKLHEEGKKKLAEKKNRKLLSFHESLGYFAPSFGLDVVASMEEGPGDEPTSPRMTMLIAKCQEKDVHVIAVEPQFSAHGSAETLQKELKRRDHEVQLITVDPLETVDPSDLQGEHSLRDKNWYEVQMRKNIDALAGALK
jgi:ABC-type Zn uptake system ZnuABC Zn-binding protein ZnuA